MRASTAGTRRGVRREGASHRRSPRARTKQRRARPRRGRNALGHARARDPRSPLHQRGRTARRLLPCPWTPNGSRAHRAPGQNEDFRGHAGSPHPGLARLLAPPSPAVPGRRAAGGLAEVLALTRCPAPGGSPRLTPASLPRRLLVHLPPQERRYLERLRCRRTSPAAGFGVRPAPVCRLPRLGMRGTLRPPHRLRVRAARLRSTSLSRGSTWPKPVAITVISISPSMLGSITAPKITLASSPAAADHHARGLVDLVQREVAAAGDVHAARPRRPRSRRPRAAGSTPPPARPRPRGSGPMARPVPISALPRFDITAFTSAKSRFTRPGTVTRSEMPLVALSSTSSHTLNASVSERALVDHREQALVRDHDQRVDLGAQLVEPLFGLAHAAAALERERLGDHRHGERAGLLGEPRHHRRRAGAGAAAHAGGDEHHVAVRERVGDRLLVLLRRAPALRGIAARAQAARRVGADLDARRRERLVERLDVGVGGDEVHAAQAGADHAVDGVAAGAADSDDLELGRCGAVDFEFEARTWALLPVPARGARGAVDPAPTTPRSRALIGLEQIAEPATQIESGVAAVRRDLRRSRAPFSPPPPCTACSTSPTPVENRGSRHVGRRARPVPAGRRAAPASRTPARPARPRPASARSRR